MKTALIILTHNAGERWKETLGALDAQTLQPDHKLIIDSGSTDDTCAQAEEHAFELLRIPKEKFDHGQTRQLGAEQFPEADLLIYMTQDVILTGNKSLEILINGFKNPSVSASYGRQIPCLDATGGEKVMRAYNYPETSTLKTEDDIPEMGLHTPFCSNSFAAYRKADLLKIGGFPKTDFGEDMLVAAKLILNGNAIFYNAEATVIHSHSDTLKTAFQRGRSIGEMHKQNPWLLNAFGAAEKKSATIAMLCQTILKYHGLRQTIQFATQTQLKYLGYFLQKNLNASKLR